MSGSAGIWKPVSIKLIDEMVAKQVNIDKYYLFSYVNTIQSILSSLDPGPLRNGYREVERLFLQFNNYVYLIADICTPIYNFYQTVIFQYLDIFQQYIL